MATLLRTVPLTLTVDKDDLILSGDGYEVRHETTTADLDDLFALVTRRVQKATREARTAGTAATLDQVRALAEKLSSLADRIGSAQIEVRDEAKQREGRMEPGKPQ